MKPILRIFSGVAACLLVLLCGVLLALSGLSLYERICFVIEMSYRVVSSDTLISVEIFMFSLGTLILVFRMFRDGDEKDAKTTCDDKEDFLLRGSYVENLRNRIVNQKSSDGLSARYFAIYGKWGEGKTFVLESLKKLANSGDCEFIVFSPWNIPNGKITPDSLFGVIASQIKGRVGCAFDRFASRISPSSAKDLISLVPVAGEALSRLYLLSRDPTVAKKRLRKLLLDEGRRYVIVLDDMDRLAPDEIYSILRLIRANGDLPNVTYLILADKLYLASALNTALSLDARDKICNGMAYLEKIIQDEFDLPAVNNDILMMMVLKKVANIVRDKSVQGFDAKRADLSDVSSLVTSIRDVNRLVDAFAWDFNLQYSKVNKGRGKNKLVKVKVNIEDLVALTALRLYAKNVFKGIFGWLSNASQEFELHVNKETFAESVLKCNDRTITQLAMGFLKKRLKIVVLNVESDSWYTFIRHKAENDDVLNHRLCVQRCFYDYFLGYDAGLPSRNELNEFNNALQNVGRGEQFIREKIRLGKLSWFLMMFNARTLFNSSELSRNLLRVFSRVLGSREIDGANNDTMRDLYINAMVANRDDVEITFRKVCYAKWPDIKDRSREIIRAIQEDGSLSFAARCYNSPLKHIMDAVGEGGVMLVDQDSLEIIAKWILSKIKDMGKDEGTHVIDGGQVYRAWISSVEASGNEENWSFCKSRYSRLARDIAVYDEMLWPFVERSKDKDNPYLYALDYDRLSKFIDPQRVESGLKKYENDMVLLQMLYHDIVFCRTAKSAGKDYAENAQFEELKKTGRFGAVQMAEYVKDDMFL